MLLHAVRRHKAIFGVVLGLGLIAGAVFAVIRPPMLASKVLVVMPGTRYIQTQAVIAGSDPVLSAARRRVDPAMSLDTLRHRVQVRSVTSTVLAITALGETAAEAQDTANAVAHSYVAFIAAPDSPAGQVPAWVLGSATPAMGPALRTRLLETAGLGALLGALVGAITAVAIGRADRRLQKRDEIAGAIGIPVLASIPVAHPSDTAGWTRLLEDYEPGAVDAWSLRKVLRYVGLTDVRSGSGAGVSLTVVSLSSDRGALAVGPQLAVFAASLGIPTALVIGPQQAPNATATLSAACTTASTAISGHPSRLQFAIGDYQDAGRHSGAALTVVVAVVDSGNPQVAGMMRTTATVLGVSAGAATAEQLARVAVSVTGNGRDITGILVADPDPTDRTTGRLSQLSQPASQRQPAHLTGTTAETRQ